MTGLSATCTGMVHSWVQKGRDEKISSSKFEVTVLSQKNRWSAPSVLGLSLCIERRNLFRYCVQDEGRQDGARDGSSDLNIICSNEVFTSVCCGKEAHLKNNTCTWRFSRHIPLWKDPLADQELTEGIIEPFWPRNTLRSLNRSLSVPVEKDVWVSLLYMLLLRLSLGELEEMWKMGVSKFSSKTENS